MNRSKALYKSRLEAGFEHLDEVPSIVGVCNHYTQGSSVLVEKKNVADYPTQVQTRKRENHTFRSLQAVKKATHLIAEAREGHFLSIYYSQI